MWKNKDNFDKISIATYQEIYSEAKEKFENLLSESEEITNRAIKLLIAITGIAGWATSSLIIVKSTFLLLILFALLFIYLIWITINLLFPKPLTSRGTSPAVVIGDEDDLTDYNFDESYRDKVFYYHQLNRYQKRILKTRESNNSRQKIYKKALILSFLLFIGTIILYFSAKYPYPPLMSKSVSSSVVSPGPCK